jgi:hypothetical protein
MFFVVAVGLLDGVFKALNLKYVIKRKALALVGSNYYYNDLVLLASVEALRSATPIKDAPEMTILAAKMTCRSGAALCIQNSRSSAFKNTLICRKRHFFPKCHFRHHGLG